MDRKMTAKQPETFNSPLEAGIRAVAILAAAHPRSFDLHQLITYDYLLIHTGEIDGPDSLHPQSRMQAGELLVRRKLIEKSLLLMMTRDLVRRNVLAEGIYYTAGENAVPFLSALQSDYMSAVKLRAVWINEHLGDLTSDEFKAMMRRFFDHWVEEFQGVERSYGADA